MLGRSGSDADIDTFRKGNRCPDRARAKVHTAGNANSGAIGGA